ncbi:MAG TPA: hypothetical protein VNT26_18055, partial [Candidatus Sulfotelmatobacter sp.]|nr:hypothetical protein [Candidatus Sulfotelmatobacter sp.]
MEPERPIEKLLRAFAKKRRDETGEPLGLNPATRRRLQNEVARQFGPAAQPQGSRWQTLRQLWPRLAWGLGALAVLAVAAALLLPSLGHHPSQTTLARNEPLPEAAPVSQTSPAAIPAPAPAAAPVEAPQEAPAAGRALADRPAASASGATPSRDWIRAEADKDVAGASREPVAREKADMAATPLSASRKQLEEAKVADSSPVSSNLPATPEMYARRYGMAGGGIATSPAPLPPIASVPTEQRPAAESQPQPPPAMTNQLGLAANSAALASWSSQSAAPGTNGLGRQLFADALRADQGLAQAQSFVQAPSGAKAKASRLAKAGAEKPILNSFQVVQLGQELRVIDRDGSVYVGNFQATGTSPSPSAPATQKPVLSKELRTTQQKLEASSAFPNQQAAANYSFRVIGTNQSLQQRVVFTGNLLPATSLAVLPPGTNQLSGSVGGAVM